MSDRIYIRIEIKVSVTQYFINLSVFPNSDGKIYDNFAPQYMSRFPKLRMGRSTIVSLPSFGIFHSWQ